MLLCRRLWGAVGARINPAATSQNGTETNGSGAHAETNGKPVNGIH